MKKILFVHPDLRGGGAEKVLVNMINRLDKSKYNVTLITIFKEGTNKEILSNDVEHKFIFKKVLSGWSRLQKIFSPSFLFKYIAKDDYDIVVAYLEGVPTRIVGGCQSKNTKIISWLHVDLDGFNIEKVFRSSKEMENIYLKYDSIIGVSKTALKSLHKKIPLLPKNKLKVIHNVIDIDFIISRGNKKIKDYTFPKNVVKICTVGRLAQQKGYIRLLNVITKLVKEKLALHLIIIGQGEQENNLRIIIKDNNLKNHVSLLGFKSNPHKYVKNSDLFVCSSFQEGFSTAVTESVILKTPVLTTNCAGMDEILEDGKFGMIVDNEEKALYEGLKMLITNNDLLNKYKLLAEERSEFLQKKNNIIEIENLFDTISNN